MISQVAVALSSEGTPKVGRLDQTFRQILAAVQGQQRHKKDLRMEQRTKKVAVGIARPTREAMRGKVEVIHRECKCRKLRLPNFNLGTHVHLKALLETM